MTTSDPRPADLTAQEREALERLVPAVWRQTGWGADATASLVRTALVAVPSLASAAPSRGQVEGPERECPKCGWITTFAECCPDSPAPVASPEAPKELVPASTFKGCAKCGGLAACWCAPAGPETGWLTMTVERATFLRHAAFHGYVGNVADNMRSMWKELDATRSALSAATNRGDNFRELCRSAEARMREHRTRCAAALKLAGEVMVAFEKFGMRHGLTIGANPYWRSRLAALSSPSAPESGTQGVKE